MNCRIPALGSPIARATAAGGSHRGSFGFGATAVADMEYDATAGGSGSVAHTCTRPRVVPARNAPSAESAITSIGRVVAAGTAIVRLPDATRLPPPGPSATTSFAGFGHLMAYVPMYDDRGRDATWSTRRSRRPTNQISPRPACPSRARR